MLKVVLGRDRVEVARTIGLIAAVVFAGVALIQLSVQRTTEASQASAGAAASGVARHFAAVLATYDYGHPEVQLTQLQPLGSAAVLEQVARAQGDLRTASASSIGDAENSWIAGVGGGRADILVQVRQVASNRFATASRALTGLLECHLQLNPQRQWIVESFKWLEVPSAPAVG